MSVNKFKFVSPGVFVAEVDNSQLPALPRGVGPVVIGRSLKGPAMRPIQVDSFSDFVETFGDPIFGGGSSDVWRSGPNVSAPSYATYAAQAYLRNQSPLVFVRLAGVQDDEASNPGRAGWEANDTSMAAGSPSSMAGGAFGLFLIPSASNPTTGNLGTGSLAAIFYARTGAVSLSGTLADGVTTGEGTAGVFKSTGKSQFTAVIKGTTGAVTDKISFNFDENSKLFIRNVFNTNPTLMNSDTNVNASGAKTYFLGESFERSVTDLYDGSDANPPGYAVILGLDSGSVEQHQQRMPLSDASTGWFFGQDLGTSSAYVATDMPKLFRFIGLGGGEWSQDNLKISITSITPSNNEASPYGYFTLQIRQLGDSDNNPKPVETYSDVDLNPNSPNFISRKIGDSWTEWDSDSKRYISYGDYVNKSRYVRIELDPQVGNGADAKLLPFGIYGPARWKGFTVISGAADVLPLGETDPGAAAFDEAYVIGSGSIPDQVSPESGHFIYVGSSSVSDITASFEFPRVPTRTNSDEGVITNQKGAYFGATANKVASNRVEPSVKDMLRRKPENMDSFTTIPDELEYSWVVSLDDVKPSTTAGTLATWVSGSRRDGDSYTALSASYKTVLDAGFNKITTVLNAGFEGLDILEKEPFRNSGMPTSATPGNNYAFASLDRAIDTVSDAEVVECNMATVPGITNPKLTSKLLDVCEARADALAIIDLQGGYEPPTEDADKTDSERIGTVNGTISTFEDRNINNSYGCAYYPWVQITDTVTTGGSLWVPPSVVILGTLASSQAASELWFAPAGFTRGGLSEGSAGVPVTNVRSRLNSQERDDLYNAGINPIAQFPAEGIVVFGQKTLQVTRSALDRINVRRLMIFVKRRISQISATLLFDQNVTATWGRFLGQVNPFLGSIQTRLGLTDYKVILDETTTTPDLVDRNILYAKIFLKPARAIEFIALDFVITRSGASFED